MQVWIEDSIGDIWSPRCSHIRFLRFHSSSDSYENVHLTKTWFFLFVDLHVVKVKFLVVKNGTKEDSLRFYICKFFNLVWTIGCTANENLNWFFRSGGWGVVGRNLYIVLVYGSNKFRSMVRMWNFVEKCKEAIGGITRSYVEYAD